MTAAVNSVRSTFLKGMTDDEIRTKCSQVSDEVMARMFPGSTVHAANLAEALSEAGADFEVVKRPLLAVHGMVDDEGAPITAVATHVATTRTDTNQVLGIVGADTYGIVQTARAMESLDILARRGDVQIKKVELIGEGARVRVTALMGVTSFPSMDGSPNTLGHFAVFEATHDGSASTTASVFTLRMECFNGMTSKERVGTHKLRHTSKAGDRVEQLTQEILATLIGDVETERELFLSMVGKHMNRQGFQSFATELLGGLPDEDDSQTKRTRFANQLDELCGYFEGGNQGAGETAWGAYNSVTRWLESKREGIEDAAKAAQKFDSNVNGAGQRRLQRAVRLLTN